MAPLSGSLRERNMWLTSFCLYDQYSRFEMRSSSFSKLPATSVVSHAYCKLEIVLLHVDLDSSYKPV